MALTRERHFVILGAFAGLIAGATMGVWTLAAQRPGHTATFVSDATPPPAPRCPDGYRAATGLDASATVEGTHVRWLVRCDPVASGSPISEALEMFWTPQMYLDGRVRGDRLVDLVRVLLPRDTVHFDRALAPRGATVNGIVAAFVDAEGQYQIPPFVVRVWALPAGGHTLQVTLSAPRARADGIAVNVRRTLDGVGGLRAYEPVAVPTRGWSVDVQCPAGFTDATPPNGGIGRSTFIGRTCLAPDADGGAELTFAEITARADSEEAFRQVLQMTLSGLSATGVTNDTGFQPSQRVRIGGFDAYTARLDVTPPVARVRVIAYQLPAFDGSVFALAMALRANFDGTRTAMSQWLDHASVVRNYDPAVVATRRRSRMIGGLVLPAVISTFVGMLVGRWWSRRKDRLQID